MKVLLRFLLMVVLVVYLFVAFFVLRSHAAEEKCLDLQVEVLDSATHHYISPADVYRYIDDKKEALCEDKQRMCGKVFCAIQADRIIVNKGCK